MTTNGHAADVIRADHLKKYFPVTRGLVLQRVVGQVQAVDDVSFHIPQGQTFSLVGESGCGKTTTGKVILRLETPTSGHVFWEESDVHALTGPQLAQYRMAVQAVFQD